MESCQSVYILGIFSFFCCYLGLIAIRIASISARANNTAEIP